MLLIFQKSTLEILSPVKVILLNLSSLSIYWYFQTK